MQQRIDVAQTRAGVAVRRDRVERQCVAAVSLDGPTDLQIQQGLRSLQEWIGPIVALFVSMNLIWRLDRRLWRYATAYEVVAISMAAGTSSAILLGVDVLAGRYGQRPLPLSVALLGAFFTFGGMVAVRYRSRLASGLWQWQARRGAELKRTLIYGAGESGQVLGWRLLNQMEGRSFRLIGFLDDDPGKRGLRIHGKRVLGGRSDLAAIVAHERIDLVILALHGVSGEEVRAILTEAQATPAQIKIFPTLTDLMAAANDTPMTREVRVEDLLGRKSVMVDRAACEAVLRGKVVLVTGGCGSVGSELCRQTAAFGPEHLVVVDNNESGLYDLEITLRSEFPGLLITYAVGDVTNELKMERIFAQLKPQVIFHAAAYKHVPLMELEPEEAVRVNVGGTVCVLEMSRRFGADMFVLVSTDKAVNPGSVMGATKRIAELLAMAAGRESESAGGGHLRCTAVRFGNVIGSRGSVVPTFAKQIDMGGPVTVTHPDMTRYFMDMSEAASLIIQAASHTKGQDVFMLEMGERMKIDDLARKMIRMRGLRPDVDIPIVYSGIRPGEKLHEQLVHPDEEIGSTDHPKVYRVLAPLKSPGIDWEAVDRLIEFAADGSREQVVAQLMDLAFDRSPLPRRHRPRLVPLTVDRDVAGLTF